MGPITDDTTRRYITTLLGDELVTTTSQTATHEANPPTNVKLDPYWATNRNRV